MTFLKIRNQQRRSTVPLAGLAMMALGLALLSANARADALSINGPMSRSLLLAQTSFCGACSNSDHDACGGQANGWSCCSAGCEEGKMKCHNVTSCDKLTRNDRAARTLFAGMDKLAGGQTLQILFAQASNNCASWYDSLQARLSSHNAQCSGTLSQSEVDSCNAAAAQLNAEVSQYNANCN